MTREQRKDSIALINGEIFLMTPPGRASAIYAEGGIIKAIGSDKDILSLCSGRTTVLDMKGKYVMPGFTDTHNHLLATGRNIETLNLKGMLSISDMVRKGKEFLTERNFKTDEWFFAHGWDQDLFMEGRFPNRYDLDKITTEIPLLFERRCGHIAVLNSRALEVLQIGAGFKIAGGVVYSAENGEPNGLISEAAVNWVRMNIPKSTDATLTRWYKNAVSELVRLGITSVQTDDMETAGSISKVFELYETADLNGDMPLRIKELWRLRNEEELEHFIAEGYHKRHGASYFKSGPLKINVDGTLGARTAALREEYSDDPGNRGVYTHSQESMNKLVLMAQEAGMQTALFAIGDGAIERSLNAIEAAKSAKGGDTIRHRIVHCQIGSPDLYKRMVEMSVMADIQPVFVSSDWPMAVPRLGADRARWSYAWKSLISFGITVGAGSDSPAEPLPPLIGIKSAILRRDENGEPDHGWMPSQSLDRVEAFSLYTSGGAAVCGESSWRGVLEVGMAADMVAFMENPFQTAAEKLPSIEVGLTVVDGKIKYIR